MLIAEDNEMIRLASTQILNNNGATVTEAENGRIALELIEKQDFDLVITDVFMPEKDGYELTKALRDSGYDKPIVAVTAAMVGHESDKMLEMGASFVLPKPLNADKLKASLISVFLSNNSKYY